MAAREVERRIRAGEPVGPLAGVPVAIKDHIRWGMMILVVLVFGAGGISVDGVVEKRMKQR